MPNKNNFIVKAKANKKDEFYTMMCDIEKEMVHYGNCFQGKIVYCNCDDPSYSQFWKYFHINFASLGLKKLISTHWSQGITYKMEYEGGNDNDIEEGNIIYLVGDGDFRSEECLRTLTESDIVVTNPPFSLFREFIKTLMLFDKKFIVLGNMNTITSKDIFTLFKENKMWYGASIHSGGRNFYVPKDYPITATGFGVDEYGNNYVRVAGVRWFTNINHDNKFKWLNLTKKYSEKDYPKYDNYEAININKYAEIPCDYYGVMGVPITFLDFYCSEQFEIIGMSASWDETNEMKQIKTSPIHRHAPMIKEKEMYRRIFIRKKLK